MGDDAAGTDAWIADSGQVDAARPPLCQNKPCLTAIANPADWAFVSADSSLGRCDIDQESKYLAPATPGAELQEIVFQDVEQYTYHLDFMREVLGDYFAGLPVEDYYRLVQRRATRQYWAGSLFRMVQGGTVVGYAFDVITDPAVPAEELTQQEVEEIQALLSTRFSLPLGYAPISDRAIAAARAFNDVSFAIFLPILCPLERCPEPDSNCLNVPAATSLCGQFQENRTIQLEHQRKTRLRMVAGVYDLPKTASTVDMLLFDGGEYGPRHTSIETTAAGTLTATPVGGNISYHYRQQFFAGGDRISIDWNFSISSTGGMLTFTEPWLSTSLNITGSAEPASGADGGTGDAGNPFYDNALHLTSCTYAGLTPAHGAGTFRDGSSLAFDYRVQTGGIFITAKLAPVAATISLAGQEPISVNGYFDLVYGGEHHNVNSQFWFLFSGPVTYNEHSVYGIWIDEADSMSCCPPDGIYTLDDKLQKLDTLSIVTYQRPTP